MIQDYLLPVGLLSGVGLLAGVALVLAAKFMAVSTDEKFELVRALLPGANCGACGYAGCDDYAAKVAEGKAEVNLCLPGGDSAARRIALTLGRGEVKVVPKTAVVACSCGYTGENTKMRYHGRHSCVAASLFYKGNLTCDHGCLGFGDCVQACKFNAISIQNGLAVVDTLHRLWKMRNGLSASGDLDSAACCAYPCCLHQSGKRRCDLAGVQVWLHRLP